MTTRTAPTADARWNSRPDWAAGEVYSLGWRSIAWNAATTLAVNAIAWPVWLLAYSDVGHDEQWVLWWVGIFPALGVALIVALLYALMRQLRYGRSLFRLAATPGVVGGELAGVVLAPPGLNPSDGFEVRLVCTRTHDKNKGKPGSRRSVVVTPVWQDDRVIVRTLHDPSGRVGVPVRFVIPSDAAETAPAAQEPVAWKLYVRAKTLGPDYKAVFDVPVFLTDDSQDGVVSTHDPLLKHERTESVEKSLARQRVHFVRERTDRSGVPARLRLDCPPARQLGMTLVLLLTTVALGGTIAVFLLGTQGWMRVGLAVMLGLGAGLPMLICALGVLDTLLRCSRLEVDGDQWRSRAGWLGLRWRERRFSTGQIQEIVAKQTGSSRGAEGSKRWSAIVVHLQEGPPATVATCVRDSRTVDALLATLRHAARLPAAPGEGE